jgi:peroxin-5
VWFLLLATETFKLTEMAHCDGGAAALSSAMMQGAAAMHHSDPMALLPPDEQMHAMAMNDEWAHDFARQQHGGMPSAEDAAWVRDFEMQQQQQQQEHQQHQHQQHQEAEAEAASTAMLEHAMETATLENAFAEAQQQQPHDVADESGADWAQQFAARCGEEGEQWAEEYATDEVQVFGVAGEPIVSVADKTAASNFYDFMGKVRSGDIIIEEPNAKPAAEHNWSTEYQGGGAEMGVVPGADDDVMTMLAEQAMLEEQYDDAAEPTEYEQQVMDGAWGGALQQEAAGDGAAADDLIEEMLQAEQHAGGAAEAAAGTQWADEFAGDMAGEYLHSAAEQRGDVDGEDWLQEYAEMTQRVDAAQHNADYPFEPNNAFLFRDAPFAEGAELLAGGMLSDAVLAFEAACQTDAGNAEAWLKLGTTQAENEKDGMAILALNKCRQLCPAHLPAHMALSVSHTNEGNQAAALAALRGWIGACPAYAGLAEAVAAQPADLPALMEADGAERFAHEYLFSAATEARDVEHLFAAAAEMDGANADVHVGLGILHNLSRSFDAAADDFTRALALRPDDEKLWNKLGATLANGNRSDEAVGAYNKALDLKPGFVRAQYNLGIAHTNLGDHGAAAAHFLRSIVMQQGGAAAADGGAAAQQGQHDGAAQRSTREMWDVLRMTFNLLERPDLVERSWKQDVGGFLEEFGLADLLM